MVDVFHRGEARSRVAAAPIFSVKQALRLGSGLLLSLAVLSASLLATAPARAGEAQSVADDPAVEARMMAFANELRCVVCQNQTVADSHADLAADLRQQIREQMQAGRTDEQIRSFMTDRYGDFVLYRPPFSARTAVLWLAPLGLLIGSLLGLVALLRRRSHLPDAAFDPDTPADSSEARP
jgi:cytochrome c-type biogenesis protein CcmH